MLSLERPCKCGCGELIPTRDEKGIERFYKFNHHRRGKRPANWKGGRFYDGHGYIMVLKRDHPRSNKSGYIYEHDLVMEAKLGRYLRKGELVHHDNELKDDNRIENLILWNRSKHAKHHFTGGHQNLGRHIDTSDRVCHSCRSNRTKINAPNIRTGNKTPYLEWHHLPWDKMNWHCHKCYIKLLRSKQIPNSIKSF